MKFSGMFRAMTALAAASLLAAACSQPLFAQGAYPSKPVRLIVPFPPGGGTDLVARALGLAVGNDLGQALIIDNRPGAGTIIGTDAVAKAAPDGYTLLVATFANAANPALKAKLPFDANASFAPVLLLARSPNVLVVPANSPYKSVKDIIADAKARPGKITYGSQGAGTSAHLAAELFLNIAKIEVAHVPYRGASAALNDLLTGQFAFMMPTAAAVGSFIEAGKLRALGVTSPKRWDKYPQVPTMAEAGLPGYEAEAWYGIQAPAGTSKEIIAKLNAVFTKAAHSNEFRKRVEHEGLVTSTGTPEDFDRYYRGEQARWKRIIEENKIAVN